MVFFGVFIGNVLLMYAISMKPMLEDYTKDVQKEMKYNYTYLVKAPVSDSSFATKARLMDLDYRPDKKGEKEKIAIPVMGIEAKSRYHADVLDTLADDEILISKGIAKRYRLHTGDALTMKSPQEKTYRTLRI